jgi:ABC-2 type transport system ATP-binding protein
MEEKKEPILRVENLTKIYRQNHVKAVDNIGFSILPNTVVGMLGPNGAGKTTVIKCIATLILPTSGKIWIEGIDALRDTGNALEKVAVVMEGNRNIYWRLTVRENLNFFAGLQGIAQRKSKGYIEELIALFQLQEKANTQARFLSRGMQQKLAVACTLVKRTPLLLLDEPTLGLDVESSYHLRHILKQMAEWGERTILLSTHDMNVVQDICERVIIINGGHIVADDRIENLQKLFQARAYSFEVEGTLTPDQIQLLHESAEFLHIRTEGDRSWLEAHVLSPEGVYKIIEVLKQSGVRLETMGRQYPNLEEIFLKIIKGKEKESYHAST